VRKTRFWKTNQNSHDLVGETYKRKRWASVFRNHMLKSKETGEHVQLISAPIILRCN